MTGTNTSSSKQRRRRGRNSKMEVSKDDNGNQKEDAIISMKNASAAESPSSGKTMRKSPLIQLEGTTWYDYGKDLTGRNETVHNVTVTKTRDNKKPHSNINNKNSTDMIHRFRVQADTLWQQELKNSSLSSRDDKWVEQTMRKGTLKDRIAAMSVTVSTDPIHKLYALDGLLSMVGCHSGTTNTDTKTAGKGTGNTNARVAKLTAEALDDLFVNTLLPPHRKLLTLSQRPLWKYDCNKNNNSNSKSSLSPRVLLLWRFEESIKEKFDLYLHQYLASTLQEGAPLAKTAALQSAATLLSSVPEGEAKLLSLLVNKLGDPDKKVAAAAGHQLRQILSKHFNMQTTIAREVQQLVHRPHLSSKALYNCILFLNQLQFTKNDTALPASLTQTYFRLFEVAIHQNQKQQQQKYSKKDNSNRNYNHKKSKQDDENAGMNARLLSALLTGVNRAHPYLPPQDKGMVQHIDALYKIVHTSPPSACTQALMLLFHVSVATTTTTSVQPINGEVDGNLEKVDTTTAIDTKDVDDDSGTAPVVTNDEQIKKRDRFYRALYSTLTKTTMTTQGGKHLTLFYNLLYKAMKYDTDVNRVHAFAKRLLTTVLHGPPTVQAATLFLLQTIAQTHTTLAKSWNEGLDFQSMSHRLVFDDGKREPKAAIVTMDDLLGDKEEANAKVDPSSSETINTPPPCWELSLLAHHFHPSVAKFAQNMGDIDYTGDPLQDFALGAFLDKFAYRNPKSREKLLLQQQQHFQGAMPQRKRKRWIETQLELPLNDPSFLEKTKVGEQDQFFHRFFLERARRDEIKGITRHINNAGANDDDYDDDGSDKEMANDDQEQLHALEATEVTEADADTHKAFEEYEATWETDEEEEAFVDSLALQLMEDGPGVPADIDDGSDTEDWGDLYVDEEQGGSNQKGSAKKKGDIKVLDPGDVTEEVDTDGSDEDIHEITKKKDDMDNEDDAFMDMEGSNSDSDAGGDAFLDMNEEQTMPRVQTNQLNSVDDNDDDSEADGDESWDSDTGIDNGLQDWVFGDKDSSEDEQNELPTFADAEEYEERILRGFRDDVQNGSNPKQKAPTGDRKSNKKRRR